MTRVAVIGLGSMGMNHVRVYRDMPEVELVAVADIDPSTTVKASHVYRVPAYTDWLEMVETARPEAVTVAVPTQAHFEVVHQLLEVGCHVLVEKPISNTVEEARELIQTAEQMERVLMVGHIERYNPAVMELKRRLDLGLLGKVFQINARRMGPFPMRIQDVGVVMDLATHDLDVMRYLTGGEATKVFAETRQILHESHEDLLDAIIRFDDGTVGLLEINWLTPTKIRELCVTGERGMYRVNYVTQDLCFFENAAASDSDWSALSLFRGVSEGAMVQYAIRKREPLQAELEAFIGQVRGDSSLIATGYDAQAVLVLASAVIESALTGEVKNLAEDSLYPSEIGVLVQNNRQIGHLERLAK